LQSIFAAQRQIALKHCKTASPFLAGRHRNRRSYLANLPLFELARVLVRFDHVVRFIVNANHGMM
jgi:hypothetical protein